MLTFHKADILSKNLNIQSSKVILKSTAGSNKINIKMNTNIKTKKRLKIKIYKNKIILKTHWNRQEFLTKDKDHIKCKPKWLVQAKNNMEFNTRIKKIIKRRGLQVLKINNLRHLMLKNC